MSGTYFDNDSALRRISNSLDAGRLPEYERGIAHAAAHTIMACTGQGKGFHVEMNRAAEHLGRAGEGFRNETNPWATMGRMGFF
jgi:hypothetical protein